MSVRTSVIQPLADKTAIGLSLLCTLHCLALPVALSLVPAIAAMGLADEAFHLWMVLGVIPISVVALTLGCRVHRNLAILALGAVGLCFLAVPMFLGHEVLGEFGERAFTLSGALLIAVSHFRNYRLRTHRNDDPCTGGNS